MQRLIRPMGMFAALALLAVTGWSLLPGGSASTLTTTGSTAPASSTTTETLRDPPVPSIVVHPDSSAAVADVDPWLVTVATARREVLVPEMFDAADGASVSFGDPVVNPTYFGTELALLVLAIDGDWLQVQLPVRPNGTTAWVRAEHFTLTTHTFHAEIQLNKHRLRVWNGDDLLLDTSTVVGADATPTPVGRFYVNDLVPAENPNGSYGPWILSLSAHSEALDSFIDGRPVIAIHGTNRPDLLGTNSSNGCVRVPNDIIMRLAETVPLGTPVDILA